MAAGPSEVALSKILVAIPHLNLAQVSALVQHGNKWLLDSLLEQVRTGAGSASAREYYQVLAHLPSFSGLELGPQKLHPKNN